MRRSAASPRRQVSSNGEILSRFVERWEVQELKEPVSITINPGMTLSEALVDSRVTPVFELEKVAEQRLERAYIPRKPDKIQYGLFQIKLGLTLFTVSRELYNRGWHVATARLLLDCSQYLPPQKYGSLSVIGLGSEFEVPAGREYPHLESRTGAWVLSLDRFTPPEILKKGCYFLGWKAVDP